MREGITLQRCWCWLRLSCLQWLSCGLQGADNQKYEEVTDQPRLLKCIEDYLADYNLQSKTRMDLVLFLYAAEHICRISRIIKQPFGNALLVGHLGRRLALCSQFRSCAGDPCIR